MQRHYGHWVCVAEFPYVINSCFFFLRLVLLLTRRTLFRLHIVPRIFLDQPPNTFYFVANFPGTSRLFFVTLQALNQLFEKIMALDIEERHLLRLGHGEEALETEKDFSRLDRKCLVLKTMQTQALQSIKVMDQWKVLKCSDGYIQKWTNRLLV